MFDISALKEMKLTELQEIAKLTKSIKVAGAKKDTLIAQILEQQDKAVTEEKPKVVAEKAEDNKAKRARIAPETKKPAEKNINDLFANEPSIEENLKQVPTEEKPAFQNKKSKIQEASF